MGMFDRGARRSRHNQPAQSSSRFRPSIESLECRTLLSVSSVFENGLLTIDVEDVDNVELTVDSGAVLINGAAPTNTNSPGVAVLAADVSEIRVTAVGDFANRISLENVTATDFTSFQSATVDGGGGDDTIFGTQFADSLFGGIGNDVIYGGDGNDLLGGGEGDDQLFGGEGNDQLDGGGQITVTVTNLAPSDGTLLTPVFLATTDGIYDFFDAGAPASTSLERLAEDGTVGPRIDAALASGGVAEALATTGGPLAPGAVSSVQFNASSFNGLSQYLSFASMVIPSNDAFIGNDNPQLIDLFDANGNLIERTGDSAFIINGNQVWDAGTEVNDEIPANTAALAQMAPNTGVDENGVVALHPGFQGSLGLGGPTGNVLNAIPGGDFTTTGYQVASIQITQTDGNDILYGEGGNDVIRGGDGNDLLGGGEGDDQLFGGEGNDQLDGGGQITVTVTNLAPSDGTLLTPVFLATTDGIYDFFDAGAPASTSLERLAEDGTVGPRIDAALASGGVAEALATTGGPLAPGAVRSVQFNASSFNGLSQYLSFASMVIPSNDAFIGNDNPQLIDLFDANGNLIERIGDSAFIINGNQVWDAGTEVNDEIPANTAALAQMAPNTGVDENGVVALHPGFQGSLGLGGPTGNVLNAIPGGDFTTTGYQVASIQITQTDGNDTLVGEGGDDVILGGDGNDLLIGGAGSDVLDGGAGKDQLDGGGQITVTVTNLAPSDGTLLTPVFLATTDGVYDFFDAGAPASPSLERLAEDGTVGPRIDAALASGGVAEALATTGGPLAPGAVRSVQFNASSFNGLSQYLSFASMVIPSNDAFIGNDNPQLIDLFDANGNLIERTGDSAFIINGNQVWDAGTEVNDEIPTNTAALAQMAPNTGVDENGVVALHPGFQGSLGLGGPTGNVLNAIPGGDFTTTGYQVASIQITQTDGNDTLVGGAGADEILGGAGDDVIVWNNGDGSDVVDGGTGNDTLEVFGADGGSDRIEIAARSGRLEVQRTNLGRFTIDAGTVETLFLDTGAGNDVVTGRNLSSLVELALLDVQTGTGNDAVNFTAIGSVPTRISLGDGFDSAFGGFGNDTIYGGNGTDIIFGHNGDDEIDGGEGNDFIYAGNGSDTVAGGIGNDVITGGFGDDSISGGDGVDFIFGNAGDDTIEGNGGNDFLFGGFGNDTLRGGTGFDLLIGGLGADLLEQDD